MNSLDKWSVIFAAVAFVYCVLSLGLFAPELIADYVDVEDACLSLVRLS